ncbi:hypothetical protein C0Q16_29475, partial [Klebsiella pneumoniae]
IVYRDVGAFAGKRRIATARPIPEVAAGKLNAFLTGQSFGQIVYRDVGAFAGKRRIATARPIPEVAAGKLNAFL